MSEKLLRGEIVYWNDDKGFGFIRYAPDQDNLFFHISAYPYHHRRPVRGEQVVFQKGEYKGKPQATRVLPAEDEARLEEDGIVDVHDVRPHFLEALVYVLLIIVFFELLAIIAWPLALSSAMISVMTYVLYLIDKRAALRGGFRIPETSLLVAAMLGGWPGALLARPLLRHKTRKTRFISLFWASIVVYFFALYALLLYLPNSILQVEDGTRQIFDTIFSFFD